MKSYPLTTISDDSWKEIEFFFWRNEIPSFPKGASADGFLPESIETNKRGVEIFGVMTFLGAEDCRMQFCLSRPNFSSVESVTPNKVRNAVLAESSYDESILFVTVT